MRTIPEMMGSLGSTGTLVSFGLPGHLPSPSNHLGSSAALLFCDVRMLTCTAIAATVLGDYIYIEGGDLYNYTSEGEDPQGHASSCYHLWTLRSSRAAN